MFSFFGGIFLIPEIVQQNHVTPGAKLHVCQNRSEWMTYAIGHVIVHFFFLSSTFICMGFRCQMSFFQRKKQ